MAYINILIGVGGVGGALIGLLLWIALNELSFIVFGILLLISAIPIIFVKDSGNYNPFSLNSFLLLSRKIAREKLKTNIFFSKPILLISIHWMAFSAIVSFSTYLIPIIERIADQVPYEAMFSFPILTVLAFSFVFCLFGGLIIWGRLSDVWSRKPVLFLGYLGTSVLFLIISVLIQFELLYPLLNGLIIFDPVSILFVLVILILIFTSISLIPTPMAWIIDIIGNDDVAKTMSLKQALIGLGTIIGTTIGGYIIGTFGIGGLFLAILFFLILSAVILF